MIAAAALRDIVQQVHRHIQRAPRLQILEQARGDRRHFQQVRPRSILFRIRIASIVCSSTVKIW